MIDNLADAKDVITLIAALSAIYIGFAGLNTWKKQLKGKVEYELSRRILKGTLVYRDAIKAFRSPFMSTSEMPIPPDEKRDKMTPDQQSYYGLAKVYEERWKSISKARETLYPDELEAEALWGDGLKPLLKTLFNLEHELLISVRHHLQLVNPDTHPKTKETIEKIDAKRRDILCDMSDETQNQTDVFQTDINEAIDKIADYLKPHLKG